MSLSLAIGTAIWLGIFTSISPCPMATNIAAISFIGRKVGEPRLVFCSGGLYVLGRTVAYILLAVLLLAGLMSSDVASRLLQKYLNLVLGPVLIIVGLVLLEMLGESISINLAGKGVQERAAKGGPVWSAALGFLFALSFCPVSAGLYFGALLPLAAGQESRLLIPGLYGIGTALPVVAFAFLIAFGGQYVGKAFKRLAQIERWVRIATGAIFVLAGLYLSLTHVYGMPSLTW
jgi:cytochrome c-type biogenesis protein